MTARRRVAWQARDYDRWEDLRWLWLDGEATDYYCVVESPGRAAPQEWVLYAHRPDSDDPEGDVRVIAFPSLDELDGWLAGADLP